VVLSAQASREVQTAKRPTMWRPLTVRAQVLIAESTSRGCDPPKVVRPRARARARTLACPNRRASATLRQVSVYASAFVDDLEQRAGIADHQFWLDGKPRFVIDEERCSAKQRSRALPRQSGISGYNRTERGLIIS